MTTVLFCRRELFALVILAASHSALGQAFSPLRVPDASPEASASQTVGVTDIKISYHRPAVNKRKVWGELVPWNEVWRAGANQNTTISFSSDVTVGGQKLAAGTYGLHMLPTEKDWTVIFSNMADAWGSFSYEPKEDAARITVTPQPAEFQERLGYAFDDPTDTSVQAVMRWEKVKVAFPITVDTPQVVLAGIRRELRGLPRFSWQGWNQAAAYCMRAGINTDEALAWSDRSIAMNENFANLRVKAGLLEKKGDAKTAAALRARALQLATEADMNTYGYQLMGQKKMDEAIEVFRKNVKDHPASWNVYDSLAEAYANKGDKKLAAENYNKALSMAPEDQKKRIRAAIAKL
jgi:tetratricopeptide (TPR) repeat protein